MTQTAPPKAEFRGASFLAWCGVGMLVTGLLANATALLLHAGESGAHLLRVGLWIVVGLHLFSVLPPSEGNPSEGSPENPVKVREGTGLGAVLTVLLTVLLAVLDRPLWLFDGPGADTPWSAAGWAGLGAVALGVIAVAAAGRGRRLRWTGPSLAGVACGIAVTAVLASAAWTGLRPLVPLHQPSRVWHVTAEAAEADPVPSTVEEVAWTWRPPGDTRSARVMATATGAVVALDYGVVALDTATGEETWHYLRPGGWVQASVTPDGRTVAVAFWDEDDTGALLALDAATGQVRGATVFPEQLTGWDDWGGRGSPDVDLLTADARILVDEWDSAWTLTAWGLTDDVLRWSAPRDAECRAAPSSDSRWVRVFSDMVVVAQRCYEEPAEATGEADAGDAQGAANRLTAFDADTGEPLWTREWAAASSAAPRIAGARPHQPTTADDAVVAVTEGDDEGPWLVVDRADGEVLADALLLPEGSGSVHFAADSVVFARHDPELPGTRYERWTLTGDPGAAVAVETPPDGPPAPVVLGSEWAVLADAVVDVRLGGAAARTESRRAAVGVTSWSSGETREIPLDVPAAAGPADRADEAGGPRLLPVPGALLLVVEETRAYFSDEAPGPVLGLR